MLYLYAIKYLLVKCKTVESKRSRLILPDVDASFTD